METSEILKRIESSKKENFEDFKKTDLVTLIKILLKRQSAEEVFCLIELIKKVFLSSLQTIDENDNEIKEFFIFLKRYPKKIFKKKIQDKLIALAAKKVREDKENIKKQTSGIIKYLNTIEEKMSEALVSNLDGKKHTKDIRATLEETNTLEDFKVAKEDILLSARTLEKHIEVVGQRLEVGKNTIESLENKVKSLEKELSKVKITSKYDYLTGLLLRGHFAEQVKIVEASYKRHDEKYALAFFDIDYFKKINDTYGHECGDVILTGFAKILKSNTREEDLIVRYGGEEFVSLIKYDKPNELYGYLSRIKKIVSEYSFSYKNQLIKIQFSAGVALRISCDSYKRTLQKADSLLYEAKETGRNRILFENNSML